MSLSTLLRSPEKKTTTAAQLATLIKVERTNEHELLERRLTALRKGRGSLADRVNAEEFRADPGTTPALRQARADLAAHDAAIVECRSELIPLRQRFGRRFREASGPALVAAAGEAIAALDAFDEAVKLLNELRARVKANHGPCAEALPTGMILALRAALSAHRPR
jgi:hypothetical protein